MKILKRLNKLFLIVACFGLLLIFNSCYYKPFVGYSLNKKGFKKFSKAERLAGDNSNPQRDYKVNSYDWNLAVFPKEKRIAGTMIINFTTQSTQKTFLFDLQKRMKIESFTCTIGEAKLERKQDLLYLNFDKAVASNTRIKLSISYSGKPANVGGEGPIQWKKDKKGRDWISSVTEGIGPQFIMPCNALLRAEADSVKINITVPSALTVVSNGRLRSVETNELQKTKTYRHVINNPINTYSMSFNIGHFEKITEPFVDIYNIDRTINYHVLDYNVAVAKEFYKQTPAILKEFERLYGVFPFWEDGCKFIESTFSAMEHQSGIAMGSDYTNNWKDYNTTLIHELSHEWWGNSVTGKDYSDVWLHEGMATYSEALFLERIYAKDDYNKKMDMASKYISNTIPILKKPNVLYNSWVNGADQDIYNKGALMMHSLRHVVNNDSLFFNGLFIIQKDLRKQNISTQELIFKFNQLLGKKYNALFYWYLNKTTPPVLQTFKDEKSKRLYYKWKEKIPFYTDGEVTIQLPDMLIKIQPRTEYQFIELEDDILPKFPVSKSIYYVVEAQKRL